MLCKEPFCKAPCYIYADCIIAAATVILVLGSIIIARAFSGKSSCLSNTGILSVSSNHFSSIVGTSSQSPWF